MNLFFLREAGRSLSAHRGLALSAVYHRAIVEVTDMPHADRTGVRLLLEGRAELRDGYGVSALIGYQARDASSGGVAGGLAFSYAF